MAKLATPFFIIRFGKVKERSLGNFCNDLDLSQFLISREKLDRKAINLWFFLGPDISNEFIYSTVKNKLLVLPKWLGLPIWNHCFINRNFNKHIIPFYDLQNYRIQPIDKVADEEFWRNYVQSEGLSALLDSDSAETESLFENLKLEPKKIVVMHFRDSFYKSVVLEKRGVGQQKIESMSGRSAIRNTDFRKLTKSSMFLKDEGFSSVRLGKFSQPIDDVELSPLINYSNSIHRTDKNDVLLMKSACFFVGGFSGLCELARWLRKPIFLIDIGEIKSFFGRIEIIDSVVIVLPKVIKRKFDDKILNFSEILETGILQMELREFRNFLNHSDCPITMSQNDDLDILETIKLGTNFLDKKIVSQTVLSGKKAYLELFKGHSLETTPILSPFWPNLKVTLFD
jgi:putative glycosyltransferase (TIGR04372 family)